MLRIFMSLMFSFLGFSGSAYAGADRSVSIAAPNGKLELVNGSTVPVNYTVECYDKATGSNVITGGVNVTLASKGAISYGSGGMCAGNAVPAKITSTGVLFCSGSVTYASASSLCGTGQLLCTLTKMQAMGNSGAEFLNGYWMSNTATTWSTSYDGGTKWYDYTLTGGKKNYAPITSNKSSNYVCATATQGTGGVIVSNCSAGYTTGTNSGSTCCPLNNGFASCKVTVLGTSATGAHLQSPQFKGGSPF